MSDLKNKKLLILGSNSHHSDIVRGAKKLGIYTIVADWNPLDVAPAKRIADEHWEVSLMDYDVICKMIVDNHVDGVITGFTDSYLIPYATICQRTGLPCYATVDLFAKTIDKSLFKQMCDRNDVPTVPEYRLSEFDSSIISHSNKIIIKPVDNSGSRGIVVCDDPMKFKECYDYSLTFSAKKQLIIEKYIELDSISVSYTIQDGVPSLSTINDDCLCKTENGNAVNCGCLYPSKYIEFYRVNIDNKVRDMLINEGFKNGVLFMQAFTNGKEIYFFEMGYRLSGGRHFLFTENQNNSSSLTQLIHFAITGKMADYKIIERDNPNFKDCCCRLTLIGKPGIINSVEGEDYLKNKKEVIYYSFLKSVGDEIGQPGTTATQLLGISIVVEKQDDLGCIIDSIFKNVHFYDKEGHSIVLPRQF